jgi:hypothetical protein
VLVFFPRGQIERPRLVFRFSAISSDLLVRLFNFLIRNVIARLELGIATVNDTNVLNDTTVAYFSVRRLDKSKLIDTSEAR